MILVKKTAVAASTKTHIEDTEGNEKCGLSLYLLSVSDME